MPEPLGLKIKKQNKTGRLNALPVKVIYWWLQIFIERKKSSFCQ
jgi:hypothetical protein